MGKERGFSTVEMIVAVAVVTITMVASAPFFVNGLAAVARQRSRQGAIQLAETAMEQVRGLKGSALLAGRGVDATQAQFDNAPDEVRPYLKTMQVAADPTLDTGSTRGADAPISTSPRHITVSGTQYEQNIYVGQCEVYLTGTSECVYPKGAGAPADPTDILQFFRVVVLETWKVRGCAGGTCSYVATTLVSRSSEPTFDFNRPAPLVMANNQTWYLGDPVSYQLKARGGQLPNKWTIGALPAGLGLLPNGMITGTASPAGVVATTATVTDKANRSNTGPVTFTVVRPPAPVVPASVTSRVGDAYSLPLSAVDGVAPYSSWTATGLPPGLQIDAGTGAITGTPATAGAYTVTVTVADANQRTGTATYSHVVTPGLTLNGLSDQTIDLNSQLDLTAIAEGGDGTYTYSADGLPDGVTIKPNGKLNGKPKESGRFLPTITVTDGSGATASRRIVIIVTTSDSLVFTAPALTAPDQATARGVAVALPLTTNGTLFGLPPLLTITGLPPGLTLNPLTGVISGTPATAGVYTVTATAATLAPPRTSVLTFTWTIV
ncbi:MAG TPA: putative Ig domain-containing protein [Actinoplanes sp.]|nr:putative Ig domain-containing protein [Actinoplanes sp.]